MTKHQSEPNAQPASEPATCAVCPWCDYRLPLPGRDYEYCPRCIKSFSFRKPIEPPPASEPSGKEESLNSLEDRLAADIRAIDGNHDKGAAELAEQLIARGWFSQSARLEASHAALQAKLDGVAGLVKKWRYEAKHYPAMNHCADELESALAGK
jgi:hypothetical protein